ncbi:hypothetical protein COO20_14515 [Thalassospira marina]|uniref:Uncharacterized protein n=1 Tax=Thalassospira marina TaxID=2048283 RepID=A0A2N3KS22_9PROT|nr:hypothetical protein COO20_14515 [Thalassospira marina]
MGVKVFLNISADSEKHGNKPAMGTVFWQVFGLKRTFGADLLFWPGHLATRMAVNFQIEPGNRQIGAKTQ